MRPERRPTRFTLEEVIQLATQVALEHGGHVPTLIVEGKRASVVGQLEDVPATHAARRRWMFAAGMSLAQTDQLGALKRVFFVSEGWMSKAARDGTPGMLPSQDPNRREVLFVSGLNLQTQHTDLILFEMVRDAAGRLADLKRLAQPGKDDDDYAQSPLLAAFADGFATGTRTNLN